MATKEQYDVFRSLYDEENSRVADLIAKGKVYLSLITLYLGVLVLRVSRDQSTTDFGDIPLILLAGAITFFLMALWSTVLALGVYDYQRVTDPEHIIDGFGSSPPTNEEFFDDRIADLAVATNHNCAKNNRRASILRSASILLVLGIIMHTALFACQTWERFRDVQQEESNEEELPEKEKRQTTIETLSGSYARKGL